MTLARTVAKLTDNELHAINTHGYPPRALDYDWHELLAEIIVETKAPVREVEEACLLERDRRFRERGAAR